MQISIKSDIKNVLREFQDIKETSIPYAISGAINDTLFELRKVYGNEMKSVFDKPVNFTTMPSAWNVDKANRQALRGTIKLKDVQASYLEWQIEGGHRTPKKRAIPIPQEGGAAIASHGGLKRNWKSILTDKRRYFSGVPKGMPGARPGVYKRLGATKKLPAGHKIRLELAWEDGADYTKRFKFYESSYFHAHRLFIDKFRQRLLASRIYQQTH